MKKLLILFFISSPCAGYSSGLAKAQAYYTAFLNKIAGIRQSIFPRLLNNIDLNTTDNSKLTTQLETAIPEITQLKKPNATSAEAGNGPDIELKRTICALKCLDWLLTGNYTAFTSSQNSAIKLSKESFDWASALTKRTLCSNERIDAQYYALAVNDLGKVYEVQDKVRSYAQSNVGGHDDILAKIFELSFKQKKELLPTLSKLSSLSQKKVKQLLTTSLNLAQFGQLESVACELRNLKNLSTDEINFLFVHIMCDVMGAAGNADLNASKAFIEPASYTYKNMFQALHSQEPYQEFIRKQAIRFGFIKNNEILAYEVAALTRLATMVRSHTPKDAQILVDSYNKLDADTKKNLLAELQCGMSENVGKAIKIEYAPALLLHAKQINKLTEGLKVLNKIYAETRQSDQENTNVFVAVDAREVVNTIKEDGFEKAAKKKFVIDHLTQTTLKASIK